MTDEPTAERRPRDWEKQLSETGEPESFCSTPNAVEEPIRQPPYETKSPPEAPLLKMEYKLPELAKELQNASRSDLYEIARWPEFIAFMQRLGVVLDRPYRRIIIDIPVDGLTTVYLEQQGRDAGSKEPPEIKEYPKVDFNPALPKDL